MRKCAQARHSVTNVIARWRGWREQLCSGTVGNNLRNVKTALITKVGLVNLYVLGSEKTDT